METIGGAVGVSATNEVVDSTVHDIEKDSKTTSNDPSINVEKGEIVTAVRTNSTQDDALLLSHEEQFPIDPDEREEQQFTIRAVLVGCILGGVISASKSV